MNVTNTTAAVTFAPVAKIRTLTAEQITVMLNDAVNMNADAWYSIHAIGDYYEYRAIAIQRGYKPATAEAEVVAEALVAEAAEIVSKPAGAVEPKVSTEFEVGAIVYDSWGWEQTNIDYYVIVKRSGLFVTLLPMKQEIIKYTTYMSAEVAPTEVDYTKKPIRKKVKVWDGKEQGFSLRNYSGGGWVSLYEGKPKTASYYA